MTKLTTLLFTTLSLLIADNASAEQSDFCGVSDPEVTYELSDITKVLYGIVSGRAGSVRDWELMKQLHAPSATITPIFNNPQGHAVEHMTIQQFIELNERTFLNVDFFETEVASIIYRFGNTATILSQYESRDSIGGEPYSTGVNSFQLVNDGNRWCVISVTWDSDKGQYPSAHFELK